MFNFTKKHRKALGVLFGLMAVITIAAIAAPHLVSAQTPPVNESQNPWGSGANPAIEWGSCLKSPISCAAYFVVLMLTTLLGGFVALAAWVVQLALSFNDQIQVLPTVITGFDIVLSIANLGFVLGIIVIAIATILRMQSYSIKQLLVKLIIMAILVNFSWALAGGILQTSSVLSKYFLKAISPPVPNSTENYLQYMGFVNKLAKGFGPQQLYNANPSTATASITVDAATGLGVIIGQILNMLFVTIFMTAIFLAFLILAAMLLIRFLILGFLLILMPLAWMMFVFPAFSHYWSQWWNTFLRWTFFLPIVLFFLYLAMLTVQNQTTTSSSDLFNAAMISSGGPLDAIKKMASLGSLDFFKSLGQMIIVLGLVFGGFIAASKMSITLASGTVAGAKSAGKNVGKYMLSRPGGALAKHLTTAPSSPPASRMQGLWRKVSLKGKMAAPTDYESKATNVRTADQMAGNLENSATEARQKLIARNKSGETITAEEHAAVKRMEDNAAAARQTANAEKRSFESLKPSNREKFIMWTRSKGQEAEKAPRFFAANPLAKNSFFRGVMIDGFTEGTGWFKKRKPSRDEQIKAMEKAGMLQPEEHKPAPAAPSGGAPATPAGGGQGGHH